MPTDEISVSQAHDDTGIPKRTIQEAVRRGDIKARKLPGQTAAYLIDVNDFEQWAAERGVA